MSWLTPGPTAGFLGFLFLALAATALYLRLREFERRRDAERLRTFVEHSTDGMFLLDLDGRIIDVNRHACESLGYRRAELLQLNLQDVVQGLTQIILPPGPKRLAPGVASTLDGRHRRRDGSTFPVEIRLSVSDTPGQGLQLLALARDVSAQKAVEEQLRESVRKFEALFNQAFQLVGLLSPDGILLEANDTALQLIGQTADQVLNRPFWETPWWSHDGEQQQRLRQAVAQAAAGDLVRMEVRHLDRDGREVLVDFSLKPIYDANGEIGLLIVEGRDMTERVRFEQRLQTINLTLEALIDASPMPIVALDRDNRLTEWSRAAEQIFGWRREEILGQPYPLDPDATREANLSLRQSVLEGGRLNGVPVQRRCRDGSVIELDLYAAPLWDGNGAIIGGMGIFADRREQKAAQQALRESEARYRGLYQQFETLLNGIPDPITLIDRELKIVWANQGATEAFGRKPETVAGLPCHRRWHGREAPCPDCPALACFADGQLQERMMTAGDGRVWGIKVFPIRDKDGTVGNVLELATEITEKLRLREEAERSSRLASLGELAAGVAHEINNPNGLILLNLPMLGEAFADLQQGLRDCAGPEPDLTVAGLPFARMSREIPEILEEMHDGANRIKRIVEDLKNFVRQDQLSQAQAVDLNQAVQAAVRLTASEIRKATDHFSADYAPHLAPVSGVSQRIEQVLVNLLLNACQALPDKSRALTVSTGCDRESAMNWVEVADQGQGIAAKDLPHITDPFFTTRREAGGTGLGLSVSSRIVKEHGGELRFASAPGAGTRVRLLLPPLANVEENR